MGNEEHLAKLKEGVEAWNQWRDENPDVRPALCEAVLVGANLRDANLSYADLSGADVSGATLIGATLVRANLTGANLNRADLSEADLTEANLLSAYLSGANLNEADLPAANLIQANLREANLSGANLWGVNMVEANLEDANLTGAIIYGISAWNVKTNEGTRQENLLITPSGEAIITVDNLEVAQFIYLLLNNEKIRHVIDTITSKVVLILGRFSDERTPVLEALREKLRHHDLVPILFTFDKPASETFIGTVETLARMARFVIADFTDPREVRREVEVIVRNVDVPVQPLLLEGENVPVPLQDYYQKKKPFVRPIHYYRSKEHLLETLSKLIKGINRDVT